MVKKNLFTYILLLLILLFLNIKANAESFTELKRLEVAYPECIQEVSTKYITMKDGTRMPIRGSFPLIDKLVGLFFNLDYSLGSISKEDRKRRDGYEPLFRKMYGNSVAEVNEKLVTIYWMSNVFGKSFPLKVTTVNGVDQKLRRISAELEKLPPQYYKYVSNPAGSFYWRRVAGESYLSAHSFGIAIDINSHYSNYWLWDFQRSKRPLSQLAYHKLTYHNRIPMRIVEIFEKEGFFWGGRWYFYDTMHFEYRPDLLMTETKTA
jgi:peptidoglycan LD-endopeptidase CwlK